SGKPAAPAGFRLRAPGDIVYFLNWETRECRCAAGSGGEDERLAMTLSPYIVLGSAVVGLLVGLTGAGGGALMTPMLILLFGVKPSSAISSDLVAAVLMRPVGAAVHLSKGTVNLRLAGWMVTGSVPMAFLGAFLLHEFGDSAAAETKVEIALGAALLVGAGAMVLRSAMDRRSGHQRTAAIGDVAVRPVPTLVIGMIGGLIVGLTSVGSGSLMIVLMLFLYPLLSAGQLVGTDLTQAVPLTAAAALGALVFGHVEFGVTASIVLGSVPAVLIGSFLSSRAPDRFIRPVITFVIFASGLKYVGVATTALGWTLVLVALAAGGYWLAVTQPWRKRARAPAPAAGADAGQSDRTAPGAGAGSGTRTESGAGPPHRRSA
ncbi:MAG: sulfite exporter TauE/SafE family protein, partial [Actinobacteria bacterium]|nr:sulfite exporter TauE/SafE family protein [Actinomycetota bacterium]